MLLAANALRPRAAYPCVPACAALPLQRAAVPTQRGQRLRVPLFGFAHGAFRQKTNRRRWRSGYRRDVTGWLCRRCGKDISPSCLLCTCLPSYDGRLLSSPSFFARCWPLSGMRVFSLLPLPCTVRACCQENKAVLHLGRRVADIT